MTKIKNIKNIILLNSFLALGLFTPSVFGDFPTEIAIEEKKTTEDAVEDNEEEDEEDKSLSRTSRCTARKGRELYKEYGTAMHSQRLQNELSPAEWLTVLLFHRVRVPFTAEEHCNLNRFFTDCDTAIDPTWSEIQENLPAPASKKKDKSKNEQSKKKDVSCQLGDLPKSNLLIKGTTFAGFVAQEDHTNTFNAGLNPLFLWRYGDKFLFEMEMEIGLEDTSASFDIEYTDINYIVNDYLTARGGKFLMPLGFWKEKMHPEWINKLPNPPLPYADEDASVIPPAELGADFRGAIPIGDFFGRLDVPMVLTYDAWVGNGPCENDDGTIDLSGDNYTDNNNNKAFGGRFSFRPWPYREIGISGMKGQWNNNGHKKPVTSHRKLYYEAVVFELDCHFNDYCRFCGEYMWTRHDIVKSDTGPEIFSKVNVRSFWAQFSSTLNMLDTRYIKNLELVARYGLINSAIKHDSKRQMSFGFNYYLTGKNIFKFSYDINQGPANHGNAFNMQWAYGY